MPLPMVHLGVGKKIIDAGLEIKSLSQFCLGSISTFWIYYPLSKLNHGMNGRFIGSIAEKASIKNPVKYITKTDIENFISSCSKTIWKNII